MRDSSETVTNYDLEGHMDLISKQVQVFGVPGFEVIDFADWQAQCAHEFSRKIIKSAAYDGLKILAENPEQIMFMTVETITAADNRRQSHGIEVILSKESDGKWRVSQERVLSDEETLYAKIK